MTHLPGEVHGKATLGALTVRAAQLEHRKFEIRVYGTDPFDPLYVETYTDVEELGRRYRITREAIVRAQED